ncbi:MAG: accessory gene regulator B family protein [Faecalibacillus faecis]
MKIFSNIMVNSFIELLIKDKIIPDESKEIYLYGIYVIVFNLIVVVDILLIGFILNQLKYSIYF